MLQNRFKDRIGEHQPAFGFYLSFPSPEITEFMGYAGFDYVLIDAEHFTFNLETIQSIARAANLSGMTPVARVAKNDKELILGYLEAGILGVVVPHIDSVEAACAAVEAVKFPPMGRRGAGSCTRPANYGLTQSSPEYFDTANHQTLVLAMIEDRVGLERLSEILEVDGIDGVSIGSGDLALSLEYPGQPNHPEVLKLVSAARSQIVASRKLLGVMANSGENSRKAVLDGAGYVTMNMNELLSRAVRDYIQTARAID